MRESDRSMERRKDTQRGSVGSTTGSCSFAFLFFLPAENMSIWNVLAYMRGTFSRVAGHFFFSFCSVVARLLSLLDSCILFFFYR